jgi:hypothetical protein
MDRFAKLQILGPTALFLAVLASEGAAYALQMSPSSPTLWYLNLVWLGIFQRSHYALTGAVDIAYFQLLFVVLPIFLLAAYGFLFRRRLCLAIASNLSLVFVCFVFFAWRAYEPSVQEASLTIVSTPAGPDVVLCVALLGFSLLSFVVSHLGYLHALRTDH